MQFLVIHRPAPWKVGNASHFLNVERRLAQQVRFIRSLRDKKTIESGPYAILNAAAAMTAFIANTDSWESLSHILHEDPMAVYQAPDIYYLSDWEKAMGKHADTIGADRTLLEDVRVDAALDLPRQRDAAEATLQAQADEIRLLRAEVGTLIRQLNAGGNAKK